MKQINKCRVLCLAILTILAADCKSDEGILEITNVTSFLPIVSTKGTSSEKLHLYGITDKELTAIQFAQINWSNLTADMAKGQGENLATMADLLSIRDTKKAAFYAICKNKFTELIPTSDTNAEQLVINLKTESARL